MSLDFTLICWRISLKVVKSFFVLIVIIGNEKMSKVVLRSKITVDTRRVSMSFNNNDKKRTYSFGRYRYYKDYNIKYNLYTAP